MDATLYLENYLTQQRMKDGLFRRWTEREVGDASVKMVRDLKRWSAKRVLIKTQDATFCRNERELGLLRLKLAREGILVEFLQMPTKC